MAIVLRYCKTHNVQERLLELKPVDSHRGESIFKLLEDFLKNSKLDILNCHGQSNDNAPNMSRTYEGLQAYVKRKCDLAIYVPCTAHSLNLVGVHSVNCCLEAVHFFGFLQSLYNFFSSATHRWNILTTYIEKSDSNRLLVLKSLSDTRWSCHTESCKALITNYSKIIEVLETIISPNSKEHEDTKRNARPLFKKKLKKETGYMALLWNDILEGSNKTSIQLQTINCVPIKALNLLISLKHYVSNLRKCSTLYENKINQLSPKIKEKYSDEQERIKKKKFPNDSGSQNLSLDDSLGTVSNTVNKLKEAPEEVGIKINKKVEQVLSKNLGLKTIEAIANIHNGSDTQTSFQFNLAGLEAFKFTPITSVDVERSFSRYKNILRPNRRRFTFDNLKKYMIFNCFVGDEVDSNK
ncbi:hypothetical protein QTP88_006939 [Uroleucon formosanum]